MEIKERDLTMKEDKSKVVISEQVKRAKKMVKNNAIVQQMEQEGQR